MRKYNFLRMQLQLADPCEMMFITRSMTDGVHHQGAHPMETSVITAQASQDLPEKDLRQAMDTEDE